MTTNTIVGTFAVAAATTTTMGRVRTAAGTGRTRTRADITITIMVKMVGAMTKALFVPTPSWKSGRLLLLRHD